MKTQPPSLPAVFLGHGTPMNTLEDNSFTQTWKKFGASIPTPKAILCISAHWFVDHTAVTAMPHPHTLHDFGGFPEKLFRFQYPASGDPELAQKIKKILSPTSVKLDHSWGLDHGAWSVLAHVFPEANVPVVQLSIDATKAPQFHYNLGKKLTPLREEGILIVGSGNVVHNLRQYQWRHPSAPPFDWTVRFDQFVKNHLDPKTPTPLIDSLSHPDAPLAVPTPEHFLPLLYVLGATQDHETFEVITNGYEAGSISMLSIQTTSK